ncbi:hypothetical protein BJ742DRAFT_819874 [Cladochytrium replicatum]|nr:hypothetical protein BJ742DRAFT_819874 [Cladochytrium replicatum]
MAFLTRELMRALSIVTTFLITYCGGQRAYVDLGCWDKSALTSVPFTIDSLQPQLCYIECDRLGFNFFGLTNGTGCKCGHALVGQPMKDTRNCMLPCPARPTSMCGSESGMNIFHIAYHGAYVPNGHLRRTGFTLSDQLNIEISSNDGIMPLFGEIIVIEKVSIFNPGSVKIMFPLSTGRFSLFSTNITISGKGILRVLYNSTNESFQLNWNNNSVLVEGVQIQQTGLRTVQSQLYFAPAEVNLQVSDKDSNIISLMDEQTSLNAIDYFSPRLQRMFLFSPIETMDDVTLNSCAHICTGRLSCVKFDMLYDRIDTYTKTGTCRLFNSSDIFPSSYNLPDHVSRDSYILNEIGIKSRFLQFNRIRIPTEAVDYIYTSISLDQCFHSCLKKNCSYFQLIEKKESLPVCHLIVSNLPVLLSQDNGTLKRLTDNNSALYYIRYNVPLYTYSPSTTLQPGDFNLIPMLSSSYDEMLYSTDISITISKDGGMFGTEIFRQNFSVKKWSYDKPPSAVVAESKRYWRDYSIDETRLEYDFMETLVMKAADESWMGILGLKELFSALSSVSEDDRDVPSVYHIFKSCQIAPYEIARNFSMQTLKLDSSVVNFELIESCRQMLLNRGLNSVANTYSKHMMSLKRLLRSPKVPKFSGRKQIDSFGNLYSDINDKLHLYQMSMDILGNMTSYTAEIRSTVLDAHNSIVQVVMQESNNTNSNIAESLDIIQTVLSTEFKAATENNMMLMKAFHSSSDRIATAINSLSRASKLSLEEMGTFITNTVLKSTESTLDMVKSSYDSNCKAYVKTYDNMKKLLNQYMNKYNKERYENQQATETIKLKGECLKNKEDTIGSELQEKKEKDAMKDFAKELVPLAASVVSNMVVGVKAFNNLQLTRSNSLTQKSIKLAEDSKTFTEKLRSQLQDQKDALDKTSNDFKEKDNELTESLSDLNERSNSQQAAFIEMNKDVNAITKELQDLSLAISTLETTAKTISIIEPLFNQPFIGTIAKIIATTIQTIISIAVATCTIVINVKNIDLTVHESLSMATSTENSNTAISKSANPQSFVELENVLKYVSDAQKNAERVRKVCEDEDFAAVANKHCDDWCNSMITAFETQEFSIKNIAEILKNADLITAGSFLSQNMIEECKLFDNAYGKTISAVQSELKNIKLEVPDFPQIPDSPKEQIMQYEEFLSKKLTKSSTIEPTLTDLKYVSFVLQHIPANAISNRYFQQKNILDVCDAVRYEFPSAVFIKLDGLSETIDEVCTRYSKPLGQIDPNAFFGVYSRYDEISDYALIKNTFTTVIATISQRMSTDLYGIIDCYDLNAAESADLLSGNVRFSYRQSSSKSYKHGVTVRNLTPIIFRRDLNNIRTPVETDGVGVVNMTISGGFWMGNTSWTLPTDYEHTIAYTIKQSETACMNSRKVFQLGDFCMEFHEYFSANDAFYISPYSLYKIESSLLSEWQSPLGSLYTDYTISIQPGKFNIPATDNNALSVCFAGEHSYKIDYFPF